MAPAKPSPQRQPQAEATARSCRNSPERALFRKGSPHSLTSPFTSLSSAKRTPGLARLSGKDAVAAKSAVEMPPCSAFSSPSTWTPRKKPASTRPWATARPTPRSPTTSWRAAGASDHHRHRDRPRRHPDPGRRTPTAGAVRRRRCGSPHAARRQRARRAGRVDRPHSAVPAPTPSACRSPAAASMACCPTPSCTTSPTRFPSLSEGARVLRRGGVLVIRDLVRPESEERAQQFGRAARC